MAKYTRHDDSNKKRDKHKKLYQSGVTKLRIKDVDTERPRSKKLLMR
jgi:hypothetical protein